jgi:hypothetical protein
VILMTSLRVTDGSAAGSRGHAGIWLWRVLVGPPLRASDASKEQITPAEGSPTLSLDALTSVVSRQEAIIVVLAVADAGTLHLVLPITIAIVGLLDHFDPVLTVALRTRPDIVTARVPVLLCVPDRRHGTSHRGSAVSRAGRRP